MEKTGIDREFIGALRTHKGPISLVLDYVDGVGYTIPAPDKQLCFELSVAV